MAEAPMIEYGSFVEIWHTPEDEEILKRVPAEFLHNYVRGDSRDYCQIGNELERAVVATKHVINATCATNKEGSTFVIY